MRKSKLIAETLLILIIAFIFGTCDFDSMTGSKGTLREKYLFNEEYWGEWIRMDTGDAWYFSSNYRMVNKYYSSSLDNDMTMTRESQNVVKITEGTGVSKREYFLYASRLRNSTFGASAVQNDGSRSVFARVVNVPKGTTAVINAVKNGVDKQPVEIGDDGKLEAENIIVGDDYKVIIDKYEFTVTPNTDGDNVGTLTLTDGVNIKTSIVPRSASVDLMRLFSGESYDLTIRFTNISEVVSKAMEYHFTTPSGIEITKNEDSPSRLTRGDLQSFLPGQARDVRITIQCGSISDDFEFKEIAIDTEDIDNKKWNDSVSVKINKESVTFIIRSNLAINGVVIVPNGKTYHFKTSYKSSNLYSTDIKVPKYIKDYLVVFSGASADTEAKYSFAVNKEPAVNFNDYGLNDLKKYRPNDTEARAALIDNDQEVIAYLLMNEANYYKVKFSR
jgi:hypothetical protein